MQEILKPVVILAAWTMIMWLWMYATRLPALSKAKIDTKNWVGGTGKDLDKVLPAETQWKAHNYNHLLEQPTIFYAIAIVLAMLQGGEGINAYIAWAYVALRIAHSIAQVTINHILTRFALFSLSSLCLIALIVHAVMMVFGLGHPFSG
jgi:hypothetical protein